MPKEKEILNATITGTMLGTEDHGIFTCYIHLSGASWGCSFGGYALDEYQGTRGKRVGTAYGMRFIMALLHTLKLEKWEELQGQLVRVESEGLGRGLAKIGHLIEDRWFDPKQFSAEYKAEAQKGEAPSILSDGGFSQ